MNKEINGFIGIVLTTVSGLIVAWIFSQTFVALWNAPFTMLKAQDQQAATRQAAYAQTESARFQATQLSSARTQAAAELSNAQATIAALTATPTYTPTPTPTTILGNAIATVQSARMTLTPEIIPSDAPAKPDGMDGTEREGHIP